MSVVFLIVSMDIEPEKEDLFNEVYDLEHIPAILNVTGVKGVKRLKSQPIMMHIGGELQNIDVSNEPVYTAIYELDSPEVLKTQEWGDAVESGRWPTDVRPFTYNRQFALRKVVARN